MRARHLLNIVEGESLHGTADPALRLLGRVRVGATRPATVLHTERDRFLSNAVNELRARLKSSAEHVVVGSCVTSHTVLHTHIFNRQ